MSSPSIEAVKLSKRYGNFSALSDFNLKIEGHKCVGFLGPNGAGKTTTLKIFTDMIRPSEGEALINGVSVHKDKRKALETCGALIETPEIYPSLTPTEALSMIAEIRGVPREERSKRISESLAELKMEDWANKKVGKFSKGMKQRINIAATLLSDPNIVLLDEPTTGLDPRGMAEVRDIVKALKQKDRLVFMSSHLLNEVSDVCDDVAMIDHGKLLVYDTIENATRRFSGNGGSGSVEIGLIRPVEDQFLNRNILSIPGITAVEKIDSGNLRIRFNGGSENQERILVSLVAMKIGLISFRPSSSALEDTYLNLIKDTM